MANVPDRICACGVSYSPMYPEQPYCSIICPAFLSEIRSAFGRVIDVGEQVERARATREVERG